jgi:hypothetical protein
MTREKQLAKLANRADEQAVLAKRKRKFHELQDGYRFISYEIGEDHLIIRVLRVRPETSSGIAEFSEHEAD